VFPAGRCPFSTKETPGPGRFRGVGRRQWPGPAGSSPGQGPGPARGPGTAPARRGGRRGICSHSRTRHRLGLCRGRRPGTSPGTARGVSDVSARPRGGLAGRSALPSTNRSGRSSPASAGSPGTCRACLRRHSKPSGTDSSGAIAANRLSHVAAPERGLRPGSRRARSLRELRLGEASSGRPAVPRRRPAPTEPGWP
jgi:hypothetical protein